MLLFFVCGETLPFMEEFYNEQPEQEGMTPLDCLQEMVKFKKQHQIKKMAKSTGIEQVI